MRVLIFGATGMVGQGALHECLQNPAVTEVATIGRSALGVRDPKLTEIVHADLWSYAGKEATLSGFDACFFCLGTTSAGKTEAEYTKITYDLTLAAATTLARLNPGMTFVYVSAAGADGSESGKIMWARVRGKTENALFQLPFKAAYAIRPGIIQPLQGIQSKTGAYRLFYSATKPLLPLARKLFPRSIATTEQVARVMLRLATDGAEKRVLEASDFLDLAP